MKSVFFSNPSCMQNNAIPGRQPLYFKGMCADGTRRPQCADQRLSELPHCPKISHNLLWEVHATNRLSVVQTQLAIWLAGDSWHNLLSIVPCSLLIVAVSYSYCLLSKHLAEGQLRWSRSKLQDIIIQYNTNDFHQFHPLKNEEEASMMFS